MLLGIDFGSSGCKGVLFSPEGTILAKASQEYSVETIGADGCEMDPQVFFDAFCTVVKEIAEQGDILSWRNGHPYWQGPAGGGAGADELG